MRRTASCLCVAASLAAGVAVAALTAPAGAAGQAPPARRRKPGAPAPNDLDTFMQRVLLRRDENWRRLHDYILSETEAFSIEGPGKLPLNGFRREYDVVRPRRLPDSKPRPVRRRRRHRRRRRREYEADWLRREQSREKRARARAEANAKASGRAPTREELRRAVPRGAGQPAERAAVRVGGVLPPVQVRAGELLPGRARAVRRARRPPNRVLPDGALRRPDAPSPAHRSREPGKPAKPQRRPRGRAGTRGEAEQGVAHHAVGRPVRVPDRQVHVQHHRVRLPPRTLAGARRRRRRVDDDGAGARRRLAAEPDFDERGARRWRSVPTPAGTSGPSPTTRRRKWARASACRRRSAHDAPGGSARPGARHVGRDGRGAVGARSARAPRRGPDPRQSHHAGRRGAEDPGPDRRADGGGCGDRGGGRAACGRAACSSRWRSGSGTGRSSLAATSRWWWWCRSSRFRTRPSRARRS